MRWLSNDSRGPDRTNDQSPIETASRKAPMTPTSPPTWPSLASAPVSTDSTSPVPKPVMVSRSPAPSSKPPPPLIALRRRPPGVAALGQDARPRLVRAAPVAPHVRVGEVPPADRLEVLHADELAEPTLGQDRLHLVCVGRVPHHMADREDDPGLLDSLNDLEAPRPGWCDRLLQQHVVAQLSEAACRAKVLAVRSSDNNGIREPCLCGHVAPVVEPLVGRHPELVGQNFSAIGTRIGDRHHTSPVRIPLRKAGERATPGTGT